MQAASLTDTHEREPLGEYVAHLQLHMALHSRNLVPKMSSGIGDSRAELLSQTQALVEKHASRQWVAAT